MILLFVTSGKLEENCFCYDGAASLAEAQTAFMNFIQSRGIKTHEVIPDVNGSFLSKERIYTTSDKSGTVKQL